MPDDQQAVAVGIERRHLAMLGSFLREDLEEEFRVSRPAVDKRTAEDGKEYFVERRVHLPTDRRRLLGRILEWYAELRAPSTVRVVAPCGSADPDRKREVDEWVAREEARLTKEAPDGTQLALARHDSRRLERDDPDAFVRVWAAGRAAKPGSTD